jgi:hypothetical protein
MCVCLRALAVADAENPSNARDAAAAAAPAAREGAVAASSTASAAIAPTAAGATQRGASPAHAAASGGGASGSKRPPDALGAAAAGEPCSPAAGAGRGNAAVSSAPPAHPEGSLGLPEGASSGIHLSPSELVALQDVLAALMETPSRRLQREAAMGGECVHGRLSGLMARGCCSCCGAATKCRPSRRRALLRT